MFALKTHRIADNNLVHLFDSTHVQYTQTDTIRQTDGMHLIKGT